MRLCPHIGDKLESIVASVKPSMAVLQRFGLAWMLLAFCPQSLLAQGNTASVHAPMLKRRHNCRYWMAGEV